MIFIYSLHMHPHLHPYILTDPYRWNISTIINGEFTPCKFIHQTNIIYLHTEDNRLVSTALKSQNAVCSRSYGELGNFSCRMPGCGNKAVWAIYVPKGKFLISVVCNACFKIIQEIPLSTWGDLMVAEYYADNDGYLCLENRCLRMKITPITAYWRPLARSFGWCDICQTHGNRACDCEVLAKKYSLE